MSSLSSSLLLAFCCVGNNPPSPKLGDNKKSEEGSSLELSNEARAIRSPEKELERLRDGRTRRPEDRSDDAGGIGRDEEGGTGDDEAGGRADEGDRVTWPSLTTTD